MKIKLRKIKRLVLQLLRFIFRPKTLNYITLVLFIADYILFKLLGNNFEEKFALLNTIFIVGQIYIILGFTAILVSKLKSVKWYKSVSLLFGLSIISLFLFLRFTEPYGDLRTLVSVISFVLLVSFLASICLVISNIIRYFTNHSILTFIRRYRILLPFFPEDNNLKHVWWFKAVKFTTVIIAFCSLYTIFWLVFLVFFYPPSDSNINNQVFQFFNNLNRIPTYLPLHFTNLFSNTLIYQDLFQLFVNKPPLGPFNLPVILLLIFYFLPTIIFRSILLIVNNYHLIRMKILLIVFILIFSLAFLLVWKYQQIINEGSMIADEECLKVHPLLIQRKNSYINSMKIMQSSGSVEEYWAEITKYIDYAKKYNQAQILWLSMQKKHMDRWDVKFFIPARIKEVSKLQYNSREADTKGTEAIVKLLETYKDLTPEQITALVNIITMETQKSKDADEAYIKLYDSPREKFDIRYYFTSVPPTKCPPENFDIPYTPNLFEPPPIPLDPNAPLS